MTGLFLPKRLATAEKVYGANNARVETLTDEFDSPVVQEQISFRFFGGVFSFVFRDLPLRYTGELMVFSAGNDSQSWPAVIGPGSEVIINYSTLICGQLPVTPYMMLMPALM